VHPRCLRGDRHPRVAARVRGGQGGAGVGQRGGARRLAVDDVHVEVGQREDHALGERRLERRARHRLGHGPPAVVVVHHPEVLDPVLLQALEHGWNVGRRFGAHTSLPPRSPIAWINRASSAVRGTMLLSRMYSSGPWSRPPIGPSPSSPGVPWWPAKLMSDPPPVAAPRSGNPNSLAMAMASSSRAATPGVRSIAGQSEPGSSAMDIVTPGTHSVSTSPRSRPARASRSAVLQARRSKRTEARSTTTLGLPPPRISPGLTVRPRARSFNPSAWTIRCASARTALRPFSGSTPAWDDLPRASTVYQRTALRAV